jgi:hypothetical protein
VLVVREKRTLLGEGLKEQTWEQTRCEGQWRAVRRGLDVVGVGGAELASRQWVGLRQCAVRKGALA